ncbi:hypothetical protein BB560_004618, partial [Smittium megazygosporum]
QALYFLSAEMFNRVLTTKEFCCRSRALLIRMNLTTLEDWLSSHSFSQFSVSDFVKLNVFSPLIELLQLLQVLTSLTDLNSFIETIEGFKYLNMLHYDILIRNYRYEIGENKICPQIICYVQPSAARIKSQSENERRSNRNTYSFSHYSPPFRSSNEHNFFDFGDVKDKLSYYDHITSISHPSQFSFDNRPPTLLKHTKKNKHLSYQLPHLRSPTQVINVNESPDLSQTMEQTFISKKNSSLDKYRDSMFSVSNAMQNATLYDILCSVVGKPLGPDALDSDNTDSSSDSDLDSSSQFSDDDSNQMKSVDSLRTSPTSSGNNSSYHRSTVSTNSIRAFQNTGNHNSIEFKSRSGIVISENRKASNIMLSSFLDNLPNESKPSSKIEPKDTYDLFDANQIILTRSFPSTEQINFALLESLLSTSSSSSDSTLDNNQSTNLQKSDSKTSGNDHSSPSPNPASKISPQFENVSNSSSPNNNSNSKSTDEPTFIPKLVVSNDSALSDSKSNSQDSSLQAPVPPTKPVKFYDIVDLIPILCDFPSL